MARDRTRWSPFALAAGALALASGCIPDVVPDQFSAPNCEGVEAACGPSGKESCCAVGKVAGGDFQRLDAMNDQAHVSDFVLDRFEVTVGRFRQFVASYPNDRPAEGAGEHPRIAGSGWDPAWDALLPESRDALKAEIGACSDYFVTWTDEPGANETLPINCTSWYVAFAFCAWDGGRLPTAAEWNYAAAGGKQQRPYPWGTETPDMVGVVDNCSSSFATCVRRGGSTSPESDGLYGQADLAGNMAEWTLDYYAELATPCADCAVVSIADDSYGRDVRGGSFASDAADLVTTYRIGYAPGVPLNTVGIRCARDQ